MEVRDQVRDFHFISPMTFQAKLPVFPLIPRFVRVLYGIDTVSPRLSPQYSIQMLSTCMYHG
jgi:hypothetical protein